MITGSVNRPAAEKLKRGRHLYQAWARGYHGEGRVRLLAERAEELLIREGVGWASSEQAAGQGPGTPL